jgi:broad-specificity NMP kinase
LDQLKVCNAHNSELIQKMNVIFERMDKRDEVIIDLINMMKELIIGQRQNSGNIISSNNNNFNKNK